MTDTLYNSIVPYLKIEKINPTKLNINTSTIKELSSHPYIDFYLAKAIIKFRIELNNYKSIDQLRQIHLLDQKTYEKLLPYLEL
jgi:DNA uptake protein ComE-like DNA-binding protein